MLGVQLGRFSAVKPSWAALPGQRSVALRGGERETSPWGAGCDPSAAGELMATTGLAPERGVMLLLASQEGRLSSVLCFLPTRRNEERNKAAVIGTLGCYQHPAWQWLLWHSWSISRESAAPHFLRTHTGGWKSLVRPWNPFP